MGFMKKLLFCLSIFGATNCMDISEKYKEKPLWTHFYIHTATRGATLQKGDFTLIHHEDGKIDIVRGTQIIYQSLNFAMRSKTFSGNIKGRMKFFFEGYSNKSILIIDSI